MGLNSAIDQYTSILLYVLANLFFLYIKPKNENFDTIYSIIRFNVEPLSDYLDFILKIMCKVLDSLLKHSESSAD